MTLYKYLVTKGFDSVTKFSKLAGVPSRTLRYWYSISEFTLLDYHINRVIEEQKSEE